jgi:hypothetical protein
MLRFSDGAVLILRGLSAVSVEPESQDHRQSGWQAAGAINMLVLLRFLGLDTG